jgi:hypothetical protein
MILKSFAGLSLVLMTSQPLLAADPTPATVTTAIPTVFEGKRCQTISDDKKLACRKLVVTGLAGDTKSLNFHFESSDDSVVSYITSRNAVAFKGGDRYAILGFYFKKSDGKRSEVFAGGGNCDATSLKQKSPQIDCDLKVEGFSMRSTYNK